jgi:hypothetical protein
LKLENTLLDENTAPRLKICDLGYSKVLPHPKILTVVNVLVAVDSEKKTLTLLCALFALQSLVLHSQPKSTGGTLHYYKQTQ